MATSEAEQVLKALREAGNLSEAARFVDRWQQGASGWLHASRADKKQRLLNAYFRVATGQLLGLNCFRDVAPQTPCPCCDQQIGTSLVTHALLCRSLRTGDNNRRHNAGQQALLGLLREAGATVSTTPGVAATTGARPVDPQHAGRMLDLRAVALDDGPNLAIDLVISNCGTGSPPASYKTGAKSERKGAEKRARYNARFIDLPEDEMCYPSYGATGSKNKEAKILHKRITNAIASANPSVHVSSIASRVNQVMSVAIQRAIAFNALDLRYTKLPANRVVGGGISQGASEGGGDWDDDMQDEELEATVKASQVKEKRKTKKAASHADMRDEEPEATMQTPQAKTKQKKKNATSNA